MTEISSAADTLPTWVNASDFVLQDYNNNAAPPTDGFDAMAIGPMYYRNHADTHEFLLRIEQRHANRGGLAHGGMLAGLTDITCSRALWKHLGPEGGNFVSISLTHEFVGAAPRGSWLLVRCRVRQDGRSIAFIDCEMFVEQQLVGLSRCVMKKVRAQLP